MIHSMTGFGRASGSLSARYTITVTAKSVNHRFLETSVRLPEFLWELEPAIRAIASEAFSRGKLDVSVRVQRTSQPEYSVRINSQIADTIIPKLRAMAEELGLETHFSGGDLLRVPDLLQVEAIESELTDDERDALAQFHEIVEGTLGDFTFLDPTDNLLCWSEKLDETVWERNLLLTVTTGIATFQVVRALLILANQRMPTRLMITNRSIRMAAAT